MPSSMFYTALLKGLPFPFFVFVGLFYTGIQQLYREHRTDQRNHPCTKQQAKYVPVRARPRKLAVRVVERQHVVLCRPVLCFLFRAYHKKYIRTCMRRPGSSPGVQSSWHLQVTYLHLKCWTICHICHSVPLILVRERSGRNCPLREGPCTLVHTCEKSRNVWPSDYIGQLLSIAAGLSTRVFHKSASTVPCCIHVVLPLTRSTKPRAADKGTFFEQA